MYMLDYGLFQLYKNMGVFGSAYYVDDKEDKIIFQMSVPGLAEKDIDIRIRDDKRLVLKSEQHSKFTPDFYYAFVLPCKIKKDETFASIDNGILTVTLKKEKVNEFKVKLK